MRVLLYLAVILTFFAPSISKAQSKSEKLNADSGYDRVIMPGLFSTSVLIDDDETPPVSPNIFKVKFLKLPPLNGIEERVDRLIQGIKKDVPPEYDHYGYEIRRYMSKVGDLKIFTDDEFLIEQVKNVRKSQVIAGFWKKHLEKEIIEIEKIIENSEDIPFAVRTAFKQNKVTVRSFIVDLKGWLDTNNIMLSNILKYSADKYEIMYPEIIVTSQLERQDLYNDLTARQGKLLEMRKYRSFAMMVY